MSNTLHACRLNHGQSEIWLDDGPRRMVPTNEVNAAVRMNCGPEAFGAFYIALHQEMGAVASAPVTGNLVSELELDQPS